MRKILLLLLLMSRVYGEHWFNNPDFQKELDEKTHSKAHVGNRVTLLINGIHSLERRLKNISTADAIFIKTLEFWDDNSGNEILNLLIERAKKGAKVFISYDVKGTISNITPGSGTKLKNGTLSPVPAPLQHFLKESQGNGFVIPTSVPYSFLTNTAFGIPFDHEKYSITWTKGEAVAAILGGQNMGDMYLLAGSKDAQGHFRKSAFYESEGFKGNEALPMRDTDVEVVGTVTQDVVARYIQTCQFQLQNPNPFFQKELGAHIRAAIVEMQTIQEQMREHATTAFPKDSGDAFVRLITKNPHEFNSRGPLTISNFFVAILKQAPPDTTMRFATGYFLPTKVIWKALYGAAKRGVQFDILSNRTYGPESSIAIIALPARSQMRHFLKTMPADTMRFYEWQGNPDEGTFLMHQKVYAFGMGENDPCCVGSSNLNTQSLVWNSEVDLVVQSPTFKKQFDAMLQHDFSPPQAKLITIQHLDQQNPFVILKELILNKLFRDFL